ncbi:UDP-glycosyltransferase 74G1-like [Cryptomeria japonica]|uniref:UDP-glycosyltransferase 74G1-like n=1 Tax=Cryptomeria japonica TaxID=3369 RepID=UPI0027D9E0D3|nr:UDP-glycosyltransferase 74G1-like [Cryptomeria japonica]
MGSLDQQPGIKRPHVVVFPYPSQGHINPLMEFAKRLVSRNLHVTFITTERIREQMIKAQDGVTAHVTTVLQDIRIETISDGFSPDSEVMKDVDMIFDLLRKVGGLTFKQVIERLNSEGNTVSCIVYDSFLEWVPDIANRLNKIRHGPVGRDEMEKSIRTIMEGESGLDLRKNALQWKTLAKKAMVKGGSSDKSIDWFVHEVIARTTLA